MQVAQCSLFHFSICFQIHQITYQLSVIPFDKFQVHIHGLNISQQNQIINSVKFFYEKVLNKKYDKVKFDRPRNEKRIPKVIDKELKTWDN